MIKRFYQINKQIIQLWFVYIVIIHSLPLIFSFLGLTKELPFNFKTYLIDFWGYYWDGSLYLQIVQGGYKYPLQAFFPGYPYFLKFLDLFLPFTIIYKVNIALSLFMLISLKKLLTKLDLTDTQIKYSLIGFLCFPTAFFLQANYTETLFILLSSLGLNYMFEKKEKMATLWGILLSFVKISSVVYSITFLFFLIKNWFFNKKIMHKHNLYLLTLVGITFLGIIVYFSFLHFRYQDFFYFFKAQGEWGRGSQIVVPFTTEIKSKFIFQRITEVLVFLFGIFLFIYSFKKIPSELYLFSILNFLLPISTGTLLSINRLFLLCYPVLLYSLAKFSEKKVVYYSVVAIFLILQIIGLNLYIKGHFIG